MKKFILSVAAVATLSTGAFANNNTVITKGVNCDNGTKGFEVTVSKEGVNKKVYFNSCISYKGTAQKGKLTVIDNTEKVALQTSTISAILLNDSNETETRLTSRNLSFFTSNFTLKNGYADIFNAKDEVIGGIILTNDQEVEVRYFNQPNNDTVFIEEKEVSLNIGNDELEVKFY